MNVGDLVRRRYDRESIGIIIARHCNPEWGADWEYTVFWNDSGIDEASWLKNELEVIRETR